MLLTWNGPDPTTDTPMTEFRLLSSRWGFPVDENDGNILLDVTTAPGSSYLDTGIVPGTLTYYGFYINTGTAWIRSGFTACLTPVSHDYGARLWSYLPPYLRDTADSELTATAAGDPYLAQFLQVAGFALDYLKTQYDFLFSNQNNPVKMSFSDLADLAGQLGMPFYGEIPAYFIRKAADNWATVMKERGTLYGIGEHITLLSGYGTDIQLARNIMLENDQSAPQHPSPAPWSNAIPYQPGEMVSWPVYPEWVVSQSYVVNNYVVYNGVNYQCIATGGQSVPPAGATTSATYWAIAAGPYSYVCYSAITSLPGTAPPAVGAAGSTPTASNSKWALVYSQATQPPYNSGVTWTLGDFTVLNSYLYVCIVSSVTGTAPSGTTASNSKWAYAGPAAADILAIPGLSGGENTWEVLTATTGSVTPSTAAVPAGTLLEGIGLHNPFNFPNDYSSNSFRVTNHGGSTADTWLRSVSRGPADITAGSAVPDPQLVVEHAIPVPQPSGPWDATVRYATGTVVSYNGLNYLALRASTGATPQASATPEWEPLGLDSRIPLVISAETAQDWSIGTAEQYHIFPFVEWYDNWGSLITRVFARTPTAGTAGNPGSYTYDSFMTGIMTSLSGRETDTGDQAWTVASGTWTVTGAGTAYPASTGIALVTAALSCTQAVTFASAPASGNDSGLVFWYQNSTHYWHAGMAGLWYNNGGTWTEAVTYASAFQPGDRVYVVTNSAATGSTVAVTVYKNSLTSTPVATVTATAIPSGMQPTSGTIYSGIAGETV